MSTAANEVLRNARAMVWLRGVLEGGGRTKKFRALFGPRSDCSGRRLCFPVMHTHVATLGRLVHA